jgi:ankyrin repeat protein
LSHGANVNATDFKGYTPLFYAASNCCLEILIELLEKGHANVKQVANDKEKTALSKAHNYEAVMILTMVTFMCPSDEFT